MKAAILHGPEDLRVQDVPEPEPVPGEVLVRIEAATTCGTDVKMWRRGHPILPPYPAAFGHMRNAVARDLVRLHADEIGAFGKNLARAGAQQAGDRAQDTGLAGAIGAEQHEHGSLIDRKRHVAHGEQIAVGHTEVLYSEQRHRSAFCLVPR